MTEGHQNGPPVLVARQGEMLSLTLNRPDRGNALSPDLVDALIDLFEDPAPGRLCILKGAGRHFCTGLSLADIEEQSDGDLLWRILRIERLLQLVHHAPFPVAAFAQGQCIGAGADLFAACSFRFAAPGTRFRMPGWHFGLALGTRRLAMRLGPDAARDMLIDARTVAAQEAAETGLATGIVAPAEWEATTGRLLERAIALPAGSVSDMLSLTVPDSRAADLAAIVETAGRPGLKARIIAYREKVRAERREREAS